MLAEAGQREKISAFEKLAYGFNCDHDGADKAYRLIIRVFKQRAIKVYAEAGAARAELDINGSPAYLKEIYIGETDKVPFPLVHFIELYGKDRRTGENVVERIIVHRLPKLLED